MKILRFRRSTLLLQTLLILLPIAILSAVALYSLRQDRALIDMEARERMRSIAPEMAQRLGRSASQKVNQLIANQSGDLNLVLRSPVTTEPAGVSNEAATDDCSNLGAGSLQLQCLIINGEVRVPVDYPDIPIPPDWPNEMTGEQERFWKAAEQAFYQKKDLAMARGAISALAASNAPGPADATAEFNLLLLAGETKDPTRSRRFIDLARRYPGALSPSGASLADLSLMEALRSSPHDLLPETLWGELVHRVIVRPSFLTAALLEETERAMRTPPQLCRLQQLRTLWLAHERTRRLLRTLPREPAGMTSPAQVWLQFEDRSFLALISPFSHSSITKGSSVGKTASHITLIPAPWVEKAFQTALDENRRDLPAYAGVNVGIGERSWAISSVAGTPGSRPAQPRVTELAVANAQLELQPEVPAMFSPAVRDDLARIAPRTISDRENGSGEAVRLSGVSSSHRFRIGLELADPKVLYSGYRRRLFLASGLVLSGAVAALIGLLSTWWAFEHQLRLGEMKTNFVSGVSHELRAPLASMRLMAESLERGKITDETKQKEYHRLIVRECGRLASLVENVLDFSRISQGRKQYEFEPIDLVALVADTIKAMEPYAAERDVRLVFSQLTAGPQDLQPCWDGPAVQGAFVNLIDNAIKHSPAQSTVEVTLGTGQAEGNSRNGQNRDSTNIRISVQDQGQGIPENEREKIFEPFYRRGSELRRETRGVGIGLSIVRHVAEGHGGHVEVYSVVGEGSRFVLNLPVNPVGSSQ